MLDKAEAELFFVTFPVALRLRWAQRNGFWKESLAGEMNECTLPPGHLYSRFFSAITEMNVAVQCCWDAVKEEVEVE